MIGLSQALLNALERTGLSPAGIDRALERRNAKGAGLRLGPSANAVRSVCRATGLGLEFISRRNGIF